MFPSCVLCVALALSLFRSVNQPELTVHAFGNSITFVPADLALAVLAVLCVGRLLERRSLPRPARAITATGRRSPPGCFSRRRSRAAPRSSARRSWSSTGCSRSGRSCSSTAASSSGVLFGVLVARGHDRASHGRSYDFAQHPGGAPGRVHRRARPRRALDDDARRSRSSTLYAPRTRGSVASAGGRARRRDRGHARRGARQLLGLYLAVAAIVALAAARRSVTLRALVVTLAVDGRDHGRHAVDALGRTRLPPVRGSARSSERRPGQYAGSWSQRLIYAYIGGRIFVDHPVFGSGWYGLICRRRCRRATCRTPARRFPDQPPSYFPSPPRELHPAADLRPGALRARDRRRSAVPGSRRRGGADGDPGRARAGRARGPTKGSPTCRSPGRRRSPARSRARRSSAASR